MTHYKHCVGCGVKLEGLRGETLDGLCTRSTPADCYSRFRAYAGGHRHQSDDYPAVFDAPDDRVKIDEWLQAGAP